ncbi:sulfur globule protein CV2 domain protein [Necator americanus]|uniref:Sulfur globule protein CV2 domain protein n=1 Tax=Necator americanus TaxID=51031 RepID=W2TU32_NECAM|nr:sulfur globule protein CV2 domain protein [Necator americanus]ETN84567.1 sulfur globule protein CV2 domain protein [Necator americanus]
MQCERIQYGQVETSNEKIRICALAKALLAEALRLKYIFLANVKLSRTKRQWGWGRPQRLGWGYGHSYWGGGWGGGFRPYPGLGSALPPGAAPYGR